MKLYYLTSTLNIDNILSTESISPFSFYAKRDFGYRNFYILDDLKITDSIVLFSKIPTFEIRDETRENYPLVVMIDFDDQLKQLVTVGEYEGCRVYQFPGTLYLTPNSCKFLFFSAKALNIGRQSCMDSAMCKMYDYFVFDLIHPDRLSLGNIIREVNLSPQYVANSTENSFNRIKGFIYGYYIGAIRNISSNTASLLKLQKRIYDIVSSITNNDGKSTSVLNEELKQLDKEFTLRDPNVVQSENLWKEHVNSFGLDVNCLNNFLCFYNKETEIKDVFFQKNKIHVRRPLSENRPYSLSAYNQDLKSYMDYLIKLDRQESENSIRLIEELSVTPDYSMAMLEKNNEMDSLYNYVLNHIIWGGVIPSVEQLRINRFDTTTKVVSKIINIENEIGKTWQESPEQMYFHHLRQNIKNFSAFDLKEIDNIVYQSLAAFLLKGEDFNSLISYIECNSLNQFQYVFGLWGAICGYVQMSRTIINNNVPSSCLNDLYSAAYKLLFARDIKFNLVKQHIRVISYSNIADELSCPIDNVQAIKNYAYKLKGLTKIAKSSLEKSVAEYAGDRQDSFKFLIFLGEYSGWKKKTGGLSKFLLELLKHFVPNYQERIDIKSMKNHKRKNENPSFFDFNNKNNINEKKNRPLSADSWSGANLFSTLKSKEDNSFRSVNYDSLSIIEDDYAVDVISKCNFLDGYKKQIVGMFKDFQKAYRAGGYYNKYPERYRRNNSDVIDHFCRYCLSNKTPSSNPINRTTETSKMMDNLKLYLLDHYNYKD